LLRSTPPSLGANATCSGAPRCGSPVRARSPPRRRRTRGGWHRGRCPGRRVVGRLEATARPTVSERVIEVGNPRAAVHAAHRGRARTTRAIAPRLSLPLACGAENATTPSVRANGLDLARDPNYAAAVRVALITVFSHRTCTLKDVAGDSARSSRSAPRGQRVSSNAQKAPSRSCHR